MKVLLDTNICIAVMRGNAKAVAHMSSFTPEDCAVSMISVYELFTGVAKCREPERERIKVRRLLSAVSVLPFDEAAAQSVAEVRAALECMGKICGPTICSWPDMRFRWD